jgi:hypothetical protein
LTLFVFDLLRFCEKLLDGPLQEGNDTRGERESRMSDKVLKKRLETRDQISCLLLWEVWNHDTRIDRNKGLI